MEDSACTRSEARLCRWRTQHRVCRVQTCEHGSHLIAKTKDCHALADTLLDREVSSHPFSDNQYVAGFGRVLARLRPREG